MVIVIAILATITLVGFTGIQNRAHDSAVQNDLKGIAQKIESYKIDPTIIASDFYPASTADLESIQLKITLSSYASSATNNFLYCRGSDSAVPTLWAIVARSKTGNTYYISTSSGVKSYTGTFPGAQNDICPAVGVPGSGYGLWGKNGAWASWTGAS